MNTEEMLASLKIDLGIATDAYDVRLSQYITTAQKEIEAEGITPDGSLRDCNLIIMYAGWMWRKRDTGEQMPRMLRYQLNNRLFSQVVNR